MTPAGPIKAILFDKDGTILDYARTWLPINREVALFAAGGDPRLADVLLKRGGHDPVTDIVAAGSPLAAGSIEDIADAFANHLGKRTPTRFIEHIDRIFRDGGARHAVLIDGAYEAMARLKSQGYRLGIATNDTIGGLEASLSRHAQVLDLCEFLAGCDSGHGAKPDPGMVQAFSACIGLPPRSIAVVGDAVHDLEMGARGGAGLKVAVLSGTSSHADLVSHADVILPSLRELPQHLAA